MTCINEQQLSSINLHDSYRLCIRRATKTVGHGGLRGKVRSSKRWPSRRGAEKKMIDWSRRGLVTRLNAPLSSLKRRGEKGGSGGGANANSMQRDQLASSQRVDWSSSFAGALDCYHCTVIIAGCKDFYSFEQCI